MKTTLWALGLMAASILLALGCGGKGTYVTEFTGEAPCHPSVRLRVMSDVTQVTVVPGEQRDIQIIVTDQNAPPDEGKPKLTNDSVALGIQGSLPPEVSASLTPSTLTPTFEGTHSTLTLDVSAVAVPGSFDVKVAGTIGACLESTTIRVNIVENNSTIFSITALTKTSNVLRGESVNIPFRVTQGLPVRSFDGSPVSFVLLPDPSFRGHARMEPFLITPTPTGVDAVLTVTADLRCPVGTYNLVVRGSNENHADDEEFTVIVSRGE